MLSEQLQTIRNFLRFESIRSLTILFCAYWLAGFLVYHKASNASLIDDGIAGLVKFENMGWGGFLNSFGFTSLYYFHDLFNLLAYLIVGKSSFGWFIIMISFHCFNAALGFIVFRKFYSILEISHASAIAILGSLLFLLSPYQTENVVWAATLHYSIALSIFLLNALLLFRNLAAGVIETKTVLIVIGLFTVSLMTLEISLVFPFAYFCLAIPVLWNKKSSVIFREFISRFFLPLLVIIFIYFIATRIIKGHWIPHYGATHLQNNTVQLYSTAIARYSIKLLAFMHFSNYPFRESVYVFCEKWKVALVLELLFVAVSFFALRFFNRKKEAVIFISLILLSLILLLPSLHMYFMYLFNTENDRLSYFFSLGLYQLIPFILIQFSFSIGIIASLAYSFFGLHFLNQQINKWYEAGTIHAKCIDSFVWMEASKIYVLNAPTNYNGVYEFRNNERLPYALDFFNKYKDREKIVQVLSSNYTGLNDSTIVRIENDSTLHITLVNTGGWLMNEFVGASNYDSENFKVDIENGGSYHVTFHHKDSNAAYIYSSGNGFYKVKDF